MAGLHLKRVRGWLEESQFEITGAEVIGAPDSLNLSLFKDKKNDASRRKYHHRRAGL